MRLFNTIDDEELAAAADVIQNRHLSCYVGTEAQGGYYIDALERDFRQTFGCKHAIPVNSATSGLLAACMAIGIKPGDEVIVSPFTMSATAAAPKILGAEIVFADIELDTFCIDPDEVIKHITTRTRAVIATNLFGHPAQLHKLKSICDMNDIVLIEDNAQGIFAKENDKYAGTIGDMGVFSFNVHKQAQVGEGGVVVTNNDELDVLLRGAMNHGELRGLNPGLNLRMTEVTAAMARIQLRKAPEIIKGRARIAKELNRIPDALNRAYAGETPFFHGSITRDGCEHAHYVWPMLATPEKEDNLALLKLMLQEGLVGKLGYTEPLYTLKPFPSSGEEVTRTEMAHRQIICIELCAVDPTEKELVAAVDTIIKGCFK